MLNDNKTGQSRRMFAAGFCFNSIFKNAQILAATVFFLNSEAEEMMGDGFLW